MAFDSLVVGFLALTIFGANAGAALRVAEGRGVPVTAAQRQPTASQPLPA